MLKTCGLTLETLSNLEICSVMLENKYIIFGMIKVSEHMLEVSVHTSETCTNREIFKHMP